MGRRNTEAQVRGKLFVRFVVMVAVTVAAAGCAGDRTPTVETKVAVLEAGVIIDRVPAGLEVSRGEAGQVVLVPSSGEGRITFAMSDLLDGILDPLGPAREVQAEIEALPNGRFFGSQELRTPMGRAYTARGRYDSEAATMEEVRILAVHPWGDRFLMVSSVHPAGDDTAERVQLLLEVFSELYEGGRSPS